MDSAIDIPRTRLGQAIVEAWAEPPASWHRSQRPMSRPKETRGSRAKVKLIPAATIASALATGLLFVIPRAVVIIAGGGVKVDDIIDRCGRRRDGYNVVQYLRTLQSTGYITGPERIKRDSIVYPTAAGIELAEAAIEVVMTGAGCDIGTAKVRAKRRAG